MTLAQKLMRFISPACEIQRQEFRRTVAAANAHAEDLTRTLTRPIAGWPSPGREDKRRIR